MIATTTSADARAQAFARRSPASRLAFPLLTAVLCHALLCVQREVELEQHASPAAATNGAALDQQQPPAPCARRDSHERDAFAAAASVGATSDPLPIPLVPAANSSAAHCTEAASSAAASRSATCDSFNSSSAAVPSRSPAATTVLVRPLAGPPAASQRVAANPIESTAGPILDSGSSSSTVTLHSSPASVRRLTLTQTHATPAAAAPLNEQRPTGAAAAVAAATAPPSRCAPGPAASQTKSGNGYDPTRVASPTPPPQVLH